MATKKDLVEAHAFSRRRLVTAFLSGAPGGREVEPSRPGRTIVGGVALSVLLVAGAAIASVLSARTPADWQKEGIVVTQGTNTMYVILDPNDPVLHPILNTTSAQLIFGANTAATTVARDTIDGETPGTTLGIFDAPPDLPTTDRMINSGWTACTGDGFGIKVDVSQEPQVASGTGYGFTVRVADENAYYLVAVGADDGGAPRARTFAVPDTAAGDTMLNDLGAPTLAEAIDVPAAWIRLFETGGALDFDSFGLNISGPLPQALRDVPGAVPGAFVENADGTGQVLTSDGRLSLDPFALAVYRQTVLPGTNDPPYEIPKGTEIPTVGFTSPTVAGANFPTDLIERTDLTGEPCAVLSATEGEPPGARLGIEPTEQASAEGIDADLATPLVDPGHGAFVYSGAFGESDGGAPFVVNSQGRAYSILDAQSVKQLGYDSVRAPVVPDSWIKLFVQGVDLSTGAALCPPVSADEVAPDQTCLGPGESPSDGASAGADADASG